MPRLTKLDQVTGLQTQFDLPKARATQIYDAVFGMLVETLGRERRVRVREFGTFTVRRTPARAGTNPRTGETIRIPAGVRVFFAPSVVLKQAMDAALPKAVASKRRATKHAKVANEGAGMR